MSSWISIEKFRRRTGASLRSAFCVMLGANTMLGAMETQLVFALCKKIRRETNKIK